MKVPLRGEPMHHSVNARELTMLKVDMLHKLPNIHMLEFLIIAGGAAKAADFFGYQGRVTLS